MLNIRQATRRLARWNGLIFTVGLLIAGIVGGPTRTYGQADNDRKLVTRVEPEYPDALKKLYIGGVVRVEVMVAPNGSVKSTKLLGGSPILGQSTMKAVKQWRYVPATADETLMVKIEFDPHR